jgi:hypothetical protein
MIKSLTFIQENQPCDNIKKPTILTNNFVVKKSNENAFIFVPKNDEAQMFEIGSNDDFNCVLGTNSKYNCFETKPDYFGILEDMAMEEKKAMILEIYKFVFRFSISKLISNIEDELFLIILF